MTNGGLKCSSVSADGECLCLSNSLLKCNGQDISRKGGKSKPLMIVLPADFSFIKSCDGDFAYLEHLNSAQPELTVETEGATLKFKGKFIETCSAFMSIDMQPTKKQSVCNDLTTRILVFETATIASPGIRDSASSCDAVTAVEDARDDGKGHCSISPARTKDIDNEPTWLQHFGCSALSHPQQVKWTASQRNRSSVTGLASQSIAAEELTSSSLKDASILSDSEELEADKEGSRKGCRIPSSRNHAPQSGRDKSSTLRQGSRKRSRVSYVESSGSESDDDSQASAWDE